MTTFFWLLGCVACFLVGVLVGSNNAKRVRDVAESVEQRAKDELKKRHS